MELGEKLKQARLAAGLSQRQLCEGIVTRNMLSAIENGSAMPSLDTLRCLAQRLEKPVGYFLEEDAVTSPNQALMETVRHLYQNAHYAAALKELENYRQDDPVFQAEYGLLLALCRMEMAKTAIREGRIPYAGSLLELDFHPGPYFTAALERERRLLLGQAGMEVLPDRDDRELLLRSKNALSQGDWQRCLAILEAAEDHQDPQWKLLRGEAWFAGGDYSQAACWLEAVEVLYPEKTLSKLEICYREMGNFEKAYAYACRQR
jgi:transcriptional regulator with XRE-family HTH domain